MHNFVFWGKNKKKKNQKSCLSVSCCLFWWKWLSLSRILTWKKIQIPLCQEMALSDWNYKLIKKPEKSDGFQIVYWKWYELCKFSWNFVKFLALIFMMEFPYFMLSLLSVFSITVYYCFQEGDKSVLIWLCIWLLIYNFLNFDGTNMLYNASNWIMHQVERNLNS